MFEERDPEALARFTELLGRVKHDLGKYICFRQRWLGDAASPEERLEALSADLLATRSGPSGTQDAASVWAGFLPELSGDQPVAGERWDLRVTPEGRALFEAMHTVQSQIPVLRDSPDQVDAEALGQACLEVSDRIRDLHRRARAACAR